MSQSERAKVVVHAGMHKTGTTTIQHFLSEQKDALAKLGVTAFPLPPEINVRAPEHFDPDLIRRKLRLVEAAGAKTVLYSSEAVSTFSSDALAQLIEAFDGREVSFVVFFRHWATFLPSRWAQNCWRRDAQSFPAYFSELESNRAENIDARFDLVLKRLLGVRPADLKVISYDNALASEGVLRAFLRAISADLAALAPDLQETPWLNRRTSHRRTDFIRLLNAARSALLGVDPNELFRANIEARPVGRFFDHFRIAPQVEAQAPDLSREIRAALAETQKYMLLDASRPRFREWRSLVADVAAPFLTNGIDGEIFHERINDDVICSSLEWDDLPTRMRERILLHVRAF